MEGDAAFCGRAKSRGTVAGNGGMMADVQVELKEEKRTTRKPAAAAKRTRGKNSQKVVWGEGDFADSLLGHAQTGHGNQVKLVLVPAERKKPRAQPVKKPRRLHWARKWAAEPEWVAPEERV